MGGRGFLRVFTSRLCCAALALGIYAEPAPAAEPDALPAAAHPALWRVRHQDSTLYLFGSLHVLPAGYVWLTPELEAAMAASDRFMFEVPLDEMAQAEQKRFIVEHGLLPKRQSLRSLLSPIEFQRYSAVMKRAGLRPPFFERYQPWLASLVLGLAYLYGDDIASLSGADDAIKDYARDHGKSLAYLETPHDQMSLLIGGSRSGQTKALKNLLITLPRARAQQLEMIRTWSSGDAARFSALLDSYFDGRPEAQDLLIGARNRKWLPTLRDLLGNPGGTAMLTVGAAHIGGRMGLIALLCGQGYQVERVRETASLSENACSAES